VGRGRSLARRAQRTLKKPPREVARRIVQELQQELRSLDAPRRARRLDEPALLRATAASSITGLWARLGARPFPAVVDGTEAGAAAGLTDDASRVLAAAARTLDGHVDLLGSGPHRLEVPIDWHRDFTTNLSWPETRARHLDIADLTRPSDVKLPWELSRVQWLIPLAQAHLLAPDERYATRARDVLDDWIGANPYSVGVNWAIAMEPAMRIVTWTYLFHVFAESAAWRAPDFRFRFLRMLYLHGDFVHRNLERGDVNGNHFDANACGLVFAGLFFGAGRKPQGWADEGWAILLEELPRQVFDDGVCFEASTAYHRLVTELFLMPALFRRAADLEVPAWYVDRLARMAAFAAAYTRVDGSSPFWGDADDARVLPLGGQSRGDHRYLAGLVSELEPTLTLAGPRGEVAWTLGAAAAALPVESEPQTSSAFPNGGVYVLRSGRDHIFVDCGPVGLAGRGGHGHNDCLSVDATLDGVRLIADAGSFVYTASPQWRDRFRSTAFHSTPQIDDQEQNRFVEGSLWLLHDDATPDARRWEPGDTSVLFQGAHAGFHRLNPPVTPVRTVLLDPIRHRLTIEDHFDGDGEHRVAIPLQLAPGITPHLGEKGSLALRAVEQAFELEWGDPDSWSLEIQQGWVSPSYGIKLAAPRLVWSRTGSLCSLRVEIAPSS
jgi:uncharacterized heparinase superfamily protein